MSAIINFYNDNDDETFFNYIYDNTSSDVSIIHDLTCSLLKLKGKYCNDYCGCLLYTSPSPRDRQKSRMPSSA